MGGVKKDASEQWSSKAAFLFAAIGSSVGLGNLWRFPYVAGENGGGAFVLFYVLCVVFIGLPVLAAELFIGRRGRGSAVGSVVTVARETGTTSLWALQGWLGMLGSFIILTFYSVIAGWVLAYVWMFGADLGQAVMRDGAAGFSAGAFAGETPDAIGAKLGALLSDPLRQIGFHGLFMALTVYIVARGVKGGIEAVVSWMMPAFFLMLVALVVFAFVTGDAAKGVNFLFGFRFEDTLAADGTVISHGFLHGLRDGSVISAALGQAFFSIGLGSALMLTYGAYMRKEDDIPSASATIGLSDTAVGILGGMAIFPIVFAMGLSPSAGPTLMFQTLPTAFQGMPAGAAFGLVFFILAFFAAITSSIALLEASTSWFEEQAQGKQRVGIAAALGVVAFLVGVGCALSQVPATDASGAVVRDLFFNTWRPADGIALFQGMVLLDFLSALTDIVLPVAGFLTALFAGWAVSEKISREELGFKTEGGYRQWRFLIRYVCPLGIAAVIVYSTIIAPMLNG